MPYRINVTFDIPDQADGPTTKTAQNAYRAMSDVEEVIGRLNGDTQFDDVEWYGFEPNADELTQNSWTYSDEEKLNELIWSWREAQARDDGEFDLVEWVDGEAEDADQATRILREFDRRSPTAQAEPNRQEAIQTIVEIQASLPQPDPKLDRVLAVLKG